MKTETVEYQDEHIDLKIVLRPALIPDGLRFDIWQNEAFANFDGEDAIARYVRAVVHPTCCAALQIEQSHLVIDGQALALPPDWEAFAHLPQLPTHVLNEWYNKARLLNPQWEAQEASEKKVTAPISTSALPISTSRRARGVRRSNTQT
jgi:hypothetical protein